jgi:hypothetical protein
MADLQGAEAASVKRKAGMLANEGVIISPESNKASVLVLAVIVRSHQCCQQRVGVALCFGNLCWFFVVLQQLLDFAVC